MFHTVDITNQPQKSGSETKPEGLQLSGGEFWCFRTRYLYDQQLRFSYMLLTGYGGVFSGDRRGDWDAAQANFGVG